MAKCSIIVHLILAALILAFATAVKVDVNGLLQDFYEDKDCLQAESIVFKYVKAAFYRNPGIAPGLIRMHFHDCFVRGCDGSVLIDSTPDNKAEKDSPANNPSLRGFEVIDAAKAELEAVCPQTVSCADILAFAARDSAFLASPLGLAYWKVKDMVLLSGAHTIGVSHCNFFVLQRLYNFNSTHSTDPSLDPTYAAALKEKCPANTTDSSITVRLDNSTRKDILDNNYYDQVKKNRGLFISDATLLTDPNTKNIVQQCAASNLYFWSQFSDAMVRLGNVGVLSGEEGEIRLNCRRIN
ncbi:hypothetical protein SUGI_0813120 [Cryptomeria japonica]|nr:hypothetical protein SUGI_0813120 [Cryptomeria japonica]